MNARQALDALLAEAPAEAAARERAAFDGRAGGPEVPIVLVGAGRLGRLVLEGLRAQGRPPLAFLDNNAALWGGEVEGVPVLSPDEGVARFQGRAAFVVSIWQDSRRRDNTVIRAQLAALGAAPVIPAGLLFWRHPETFLPYYCLGLPSALLARRARLEAAFALWSDEASRREFTAQTRFRLHLDFEGLAPAAPDQYFPPDLLRVRPDEVFVDAGAYDGDTVKGLFARGAARGRVYALEPDPGNALRLEAAVAPWADRVTVLRAGAAARNETLRFAATGTAASAIAATGLLGRTQAGAPLQEVACVALDAALAGARPSFVKMDIEGAEVDALAGAAGLIRAHRPVLAVAAYHAPDHFAEVPLAIEAMSGGGYDYHLRAHGEEGWDLVCYAIPRERRLSPAAGG